MHLHDHFDAPLLSIQHLLHLHHAHLDQIGRRALHGRVDGGALQPRQLCALGSLDAPQLQSAPKHGFHIPLASGNFAGAFHVLLDAGVALKVTGDVVLGRRVVYP